jgi:hypothetical protein
MNSAILLAWGWASSEAAESQEEGCIGQTLRFSKQMNEYGA